jgi:hypothetical protein
MFWTIVLALLFVFVGLPLAGYLLAVLLASGQKPAAPRLIKARAPYIKPPESPEDLEYRTAHTGLYLMGVSRENWEKNYKQK